MSFQFNNHGCNIGHIGNMTCVGGKRSKATTDSDDDGISATTTTTTSGGSTFTFAKGSHLTTVINVYVNGQGVSMTKVEDGSGLNIVIKGDVIDNVKTHNGSVTVDGNVGAGGISTMNGTARVNGEVKGNVSAHNGSVYCGKITGSAKAHNGSVNCLSSASSSTSGASSSS